MNEVADGCKIGRRGQQDGAKGYRAPEPGVPGRFIEEDARVHRAHVEGVPELREGEGEERDGHRRSRVQIEPT